ncbi:sorting nexin-5-like isoform X2 [Mytilus trossulus]|uniref:sorting nexin-5-like isoform X2 n=1 Tax=Mytilus trossulus TaxID=6551 RepID=UPI0030040B6E
MNKESDQNGHEDSDGEIDIRSNSPVVNSGPFKHLYDVKVPTAVKDGDNLKFTITVCDPDNDEELSTVTRIYDDIEWLQHCLMTQNSVSGIIVPPLPNRPETDAKAAESKSKKQLGSGSKVMVQDDFTRDCRSAENYFKLVTHHEVFGKDENLRKFLLEKEAAVKAKVKRGFFNRMSNMVDEARKGQHKDVDDFFQKQREWAVNYGKYMKDASLNFNKMVYAQMRLASCYTHLGTCLSGGTIDRDETSVRINKYLGKLGEGIENAKHGLEVLSANDEKTVAFQLDLFARYMDAVKEMLFRRTCLLVEYEDACKALEKAKPNKKQAAEEAKEKAEKLYEECTINARKELKTFLRNRLISFEDCLSKFAESQIKTARDTYTLLVRSLTEIKQMD